MRIGIAGIQHESNSFLDKPTLVRHFQEDSLTQGQSLLDRWEGGNHEVSGYLEGARRYGFTPVPLLFGKATPAGPLTADTFEALVGRMLDAIKQAGPLDGLLLAQHGAMVSEKYLDGDGEVAYRVRQAVGPDLPVIMTLDMHANVSQKMVDNTTAIIIYRSCPHLDQKQRGLEAAQLMARVVKGEVRPVQALEMPPMVINILQQYTFQPPSLGLVQDLEAVLKRPGIIAGSVALGYPWADVPEMGASFLAVADGDPTLAREAARWMARRAWERRHEFIGQAPSPAQAIREAAAFPRRPVVLMDVGDNVGGGSAADSTILLEEAYRQGVGNMLIVLYDPEAVRACIQAGVGAEVSLRVGAKTDNMHGRPVPIRGRVRVLADGKYFDQQVRHGGETRYDQGVTAVVETPEQHTVVLNSLRAYPASLEQILSLGIRPERKQIIVAKGVILPRPAYEPIAARIITVNTPGSTSADLSTFNYRHRRRPLFPFEEEAGYEA